MRLWSLHPKYLDCKGIVAVWREGLLAKKVLEGKTIGYKNHPQLKRFRACSEPVKAINYYLYEVLVEAKKRNYCFDSKKIFEKKKVEKIFVTNKQVLYEFEHLKKKLRKRDKTKYLEIMETRKIVTHPLFKKRFGKIEGWEKIIQN